MVQHQTLAWTLISIVTVLLLAGAARSWLLNRRSRLESGRRLRVDLGSRRASGSAERPEA